MDTTVSNSILKFSAIVTESKPDVGNISKKAPGFPVFPRHSEYRISVKPKPSKLQEEKPRRRLFSKWLNKSTPQTTSLIRSTPEVDMRSWVNRMKTLSPGKYFNETFVYTDDYDDADPVENTNTTIQKFKNWFRHSTKKQEPVKGSTSPEKGSISSEKGNSANVLLQDLSGVPIPSKSAEELIVPTASRQPIISSEPVDSGKKADLLTPRTFEMPSRYNPTPADLKRMEEFYKVHSVMFKTRISSTSIQFTQERISQLLRMLSKIDEFRLSKQAANLTKKYTFRLDDNGINKLYNLIYLKPSKSNLMQSTILLKGDDETLAIKLEPSTASHSASYSFIYRGQLKNKKPVLHIEVDNPLRTTKENDYYLFTNRRPHVIRKSLSRPFSSGDIGFLLFRELLKPATFERANTYELLPRS